MMVAGLLGAKNEQLVTFDYLLADIELSLSLLLAAFFAVGVLLSSLVFSLIWLKLKWRIGRLQRQKTAVNQQVS